MIILLILVNKVRLLIMLDIGIVYLLVFMMIFRWLLFDNLFSVDIFVIVGLLMNLFYIDVLKLF